MILERVRSRLENASQYHRTTGLPYCTITYAQSVDGSIAADAGRSLAISCKESMTMTHHLRANHDAILVGVETVLADNPMLTVRLVGGDHPQPVVLDTNLRVPEDARVMSNPRKPWFMTGDQICERRRATLEGIGARVYPLGKNDSGRVDLGHLLRTLGELGIRSLMIEGGARVIAGFLERRLGNQLIVTTSPMLVGGLRPVGSKASDYSYPILNETIYEQWGADMVMASDLEWTTYAQ